MKPNVINPKTFSIFLLLYYMAASYTIVKSQPCNNIIDTIFSSWSSSQIKYESGIRIYECNKEDASKDQNIYLCLLKGINKDSLIVFADLDIEQFSLGEPYISARDTVLKSKFQRYNVPVHYEQNDMTFDEDPPYEFIVYIGNDTISYMWDDKGHLNYYYNFDYACLNDSIFHFGDYQIGKLVKDCPIGNLISCGFLDSIKHIIFRHYSDYKSELWDPLKRQNPHDIYVGYLHLIIDNQYINSMTIDVY